MRNNKIIRNAIEKLTAREVFELYAGSDEKTFISNFHYEISPVTDIKEMCKIFAMELPVSEGKGALFSLEELEHIEGLLLEHLESYVKSKGGMDKLDLYTEEELDKMDGETIEDLMETIAKRYGITREGVSLVFRNIDNKHQAKEIDKKNEKIECNIYFTDLTMEVQEELLEFAKKDYLEKYGDKDILKEMDALKYIGMDYEYLLMMKAMNNMKSYKFTFHI